jgi:hypothetical protein
LIVADRHWQLIFVVFFSAFIGKAFQTVTGHRSSMISIGGLSEFIALAIPAAI